jgi:pantoate--beta-alanine ligase
MALGPERRVRMEVDYLSLSDVNTMEELQVVDGTKGGILSGAIRMLSVDGIREGEDLGYGNGPPVRLIDNIILPPQDE